MASKEDCSFLVRIEAINLDSFISDSDDLSTVRGAGLLLLGTHHQMIDWDFEKGKLRQPSAGLLVPAEHPPAIDPPAKLDPLDGEMRWRFCDKPGDDPQKPEILQQASLRLISAGASIVIYSLDVERNQKGESTEQQIAETFRKWLGSHAALRHATFAVAVVSMQGRQFKQAFELALHNVRRQQLRQPSVMCRPLAPGSCPQDSWIENPQRFCDIDQKRAAEVDLKCLPKESVTAYAKAGDKNIASAATYERRRYGRHTKIRLYHMLGNAHVQEVNDEQQESRFTPAWEFSEIADRASDRLATGDDPERFKDLSRKMAVIYIDGNKFARQIAKHSQTVTAYQNVDRLLLEKRRTLMSRLVKHLKKDEPEKDEPEKDDLEKDDPYWKYKVEVTDPNTAKRRFEERFRIETLMWGGDELIWVVPAWCGLETVKLFFDETANWSLPNEQRLTHSVGMVFCSYKSPIRSVVNLAKGLADSTKGILPQVVKQASADSGPAKTDSETPDYNSPHANVLTYQVLESFDHLGENFDQAREQLRFPGMNAADMVLTAGQLGRLIEHLVELKNAVKLPQTRIYQIAQSLIRQPIADSLQPREPAKGGESSAQRPYEIRPGSPYDLLVTRIAETLPSGVDAVKAKELLNQVVPGDRSSEFDDKARLTAKWYHAIELWRYLGSEDGRQPVQSAGNTAGATDT